MGQFLGKNAQRALAVIMALGLVVASMGLFYDSVDATSTVSPRRGPVGRVLHGASGGDTTSSDTRMFRVRLDGTAQFAWSLDHGAPMEFGKKYTEVELGSNAVQNSGQIARVLQQSVAATTKTRRKVEVAATQAAIWHFSSGYEIDESNRANAKAVIARYRELVEDAKNNPVVAASPETVKISPENQSTAQGQPLFYDITRNEATPATLTTSRSAAKIHPAKDNACDTSTTISSIVGSGRVCLISASALDSTTLDVTTPGVSSSNLRVFARKERTRLVTTTTSIRQGVATATGTWTKNRPPTATIECPSAGVQYGAENTLVARVSDPDLSDTKQLSIQWYRGKSPIEGATSKTLTTVTNPDEKIWVMVTDPEGATGAAGLNCEANHPPTVAIKCPAPLIYGTEATFIAVGTDIDGDPLTYKWSLNGNPLEGDEEKITITVGPDDVLSVVAVDDSARHSTAATADCDGEFPNRPPALKITCPSPLLWGEPATFSAGGSDPDGDQLIYTWYVNGAVVDGEKEATASLTVEENDRVIVVVSDGEFSTKAEFDCDGDYPNRPPSISIECPSELVYGSPTEVTAAASDPDDDDLTFIWKVNGVVVDGANEATASLVLHEDDEVTVAASDGELSTSATATCVGEFPNRAPVVAATCPQELIYGELAIFNATVSDPDGDQKLAVNWFVNGVPVSGEHGTTVGLTIASGDVVSVSATDPDGATSSLHKLDCTGSSRPTVTLECPSNLVLGEPATFSAVGDDGDGDSLTYIWSINGQVVPNANGPTAELTIDGDDAVSVEVRDTTGLVSDAATSSCVGQNRPAVTLDCPANLVWGEVNGFTAEGSDPDGDSLVYTWFLNGEVVAGEQSDSIDLALAEGDTLDVMVTDPTGLESASATAGCEGQGRPVVTMICPASLIYGEPTVFAATGTSPEGGDLVYTWSINGIIVVDENRNEATLTVAEGDVVGVNAMSTASGLVAVTQGATCDGDAPAAIDPVPSSPEVLGTDVARAVGRAVTSPSSLAVTGAEATTLLVMALTAIGSGVVLLKIPRGDADGES